jgi:hypothetical protein
MTTPLRTTCLSLIAVWMAGVSPAAALAAVASPTLPTGTYGAGGVAIELMPDGQFHIAQGDAVMVEGIYAVHDHEITFTDKKGPYACTGESPAEGIYSWKLDGSALTLTKVADKCEDRASDLTARPWSRK